MRMNSRENLQKITGFAFVQQVNYSPCHICSYKLLLGLKKLVICVGLILQA